MYFVLNLVVDRVTDNINGRLIFAFKGNWGNTINIEFARKTTEPSLFGANVTHRAIFIFSRGEGNSLLLFRLLRNWVIAKEDDEATNRSSRMRT